MARVSADQEKAALANHVGVEGREGSTYGRTPQRREAEELADALPPLLVEAERIAATVMPGVHGRKRTGPGETFWQFRRYQQGDSAHLVDWRQSARTDRLYVREHEWEAAETVWLWRDGSASMDYASSNRIPSKLDRSTVIALAVATLLVRAGERIAGLGTHHLPPASGRAALRRMASSMSSHNTAAPSDIPAQALPRFSRAVLISDFLSDPDDIARRIQSHATAGVRGHLVQVLDPAEEDLPFHGRTEFEGIEDTRKLTFGRAESVRSAYHDRLASHRATLRAAARRFGWTFTTHRTDRPPQTAVLALHAALSGAPLPTEGQS